MAADQLIRRLVFFGFVTPPHRAAAGAPPE